MSGINLKRENAYGEERGCFLVGETLLFSTFRHIVFSPSARTPDITLPHLPPDFPSLVDDRWHCHWARAVWETTRMLNEVTAVSDLLSRDRPYGERPCACDACRACVDYASATNSRVPGS